MNNPQQMTVEPSSFRDPSGIVFRDNNRLLRQINLSYQKQYEFLISSGFYSKLVKERLLIPHKEVDHPGITNGAFLVIEPKVIPFISYPYEWCFSQLKDAALTTLSIHRQAMEYGMILKDASAYNIQFLGGHPILIDTLSFDFYEEGTPWIAYGQFCRHFLAPLFLMVYTDIRLNRLLELYIDGIPLDLAATLLRRRGGFAAKQHIVWHSKAVSEYGSYGTKKDHSKRIKLTISKNQVLAMIDSIIRIVERLSLKNVETEWGAYYKNTNYSDSATHDKAEQVKNFVDTLKPKTVWDLGANDGTYSRLAAEIADYVVAFDIDPIAVERNYFAVKSSKEPMLPLLLDLTNPSPAIGFANRERGRIEDRQHPDCILMLAVIHHLAISNNLPLEGIAQWISTLCDSLIIEFVPKEDSKVEILLATREDIFPNYTKKGFEASFSKYFTIIEQQPIQDSKRTLYLMKTIKKGNV